MKILHVTPYFHGAWAYGGIPRLSYHLAAAQVALGHQVDCATTDVKDARSRRRGGDYEVSGVAVRVYKNLSNFAAYHLQLFSPPLLGREKRFIDAYDLVHLHGHRNFHNSWLAAIAFAAGKPTVLEPNGTLVNIERRIGLKAIYDRVLGRRQVARTTAFVAVAEAERRQFLALGVPAEKIRVIPNGVETETFVDNLSFKDRFGIKDDYLLYLGKITPRKGIEHAIAALPLLDDRRLVLVVAGNDMGHAHKLSRLAARLGVSDRVVFTGLVEGQEKAAAYRQARFTLYVGRDEIFGLVPWESILNGTPPIVADDSGCGEWIAAGRAGHLVPYADPAAIAQIVNRRDPDRDQAMVRRGIVFCRERLSWARIAEEMVQYYGEVIG